MALTNGVKVSILTKSQIKIYEELTKATQTADALELAAQAQRDWCRRLRQTYNELGKQIDDLQQGTPAFN